MLWENYRFNAMKRVSILLSSHKWCQREVYPKSEWCLLACRGLHTIHIGPMSGRTHWHWFCRWVLHGTSCNTAPAFEKVFSAKRYWSHPDCVWTCRRECFQYWKLFICVWSHNPNTDYRLNGCIWSAYIDHFRAIYRQFIIFIAFNAAGNVLPPIQVVDDQ